MSEALVELMARAALADRSTLFRDGADALTPADIMRCALAALREAPPELLSQELQVVSASQPDIAQALRRSAISFNRFVPRPVGTKTTATRDVLTEPGYWISEADWHEIMQMLGQAAQERDA